MRARAAKDGERDQYQLHGWTSTDEPGHYKENDELIKLLESARDIRHLKPPASASRTKKADDVA
jgi:hypothetical protein